MYSVVESSIKEASSIFDEIVRRRERLIKESRDVISLSSQAIVSIHGSDVSRAKKLKREAKEKLAELRVIAGSDLTRYLLVPEQEYVECNVMLALAEDAQIPSRKQLSVAHGSYVLGLLDAIGELKRSVYDSIRKSDFEDAGRKFSVMESLYLMISPLSVYDNIVQGVRRKLDVARILIEDTRATVTEEARRRDFIIAMNDLSEKLGSVGPSFQLSPSRNSGSRTDVEERR